jgi:hypothetical protein
MNAKYQASYLVPYYNSRKYIIAKIDILLPLWHQTPKREKEKQQSSFRFFLDLIIVIFIFIFTAGIVIPCPRVFHSWRRKTWIDDELGGLKTHGHVHLTLALL